jgi:hypothetical protein
MSNEINLNDSDESMGQNSYNQEDYDCKPDAEDTNSSSYIHLVQMSQ